ncbi:YifB family Mg chelatase-like AAA ATPase [Candidatus Desulforudis audaxviator]|uniref:YifB family Mg chelatase-like AAA ATPase n=1 Tax=Candidatus Desulforudis audaxviator TaxID=471827 RepID=UPI00107DF604|nr:YifB family Mg chelatase-like AAA ATPase [Candidatus Desulforudis audaxviator]AZK59308.1 Mg chelatase, subunit ChlI [Candidatus Desulforudis audaxviator]
MLATVHSVALSGIEGHIVKVEVDVAGGLPGWEIVGLPGGAVRESKDRVRAAIRNAGYEFPPRKITVNLAPADLRKEGPAYDLPIALGVLVGSEQVPAGLDAGFVFLGELSLDGSIRGVHGVLPAVLAAVNAGFRRLIVPEANAGEAALVDKAEVFPVRDIGQVLRFLAGEEEIAPFQVNLEALLKVPPDRHPDFAEVKGQPTAKRALEVAAAGGHNVLMLGSPGSGKTMLARCLPGILPDMDFAEALEVTMLYSLSGLLEPGEVLITRRPFRAPHHTTSPVAMVGGGRTPRPGEISLAHQGVLFLDEFPEFKREALEALRQPLEDGAITVSRVAGSCSFPARIMLVAAMNPCPCGFFGDTRKECACTPHQIQRYIGRISGPLLDRMDIQLEIPRLEFQELTAETGVAESPRIRERVEAAREIQRARFSGPARCNARMTVRELRRHCRLTREARELFGQAFRMLELSARAHDRILRVARTIADLDGAETIDSRHIGEAVQYRSLDRKYWR